MDLKGDKHLFGIFLALFIIIIITPILLVPTLTGTGIIETNSFSYDIEPIKKVFSTLPSTNEIWIISLTIVFFSSIFLVSYRRDLDDIQAPTNEQNTRVQDNFLLKEFIKSSANEGYSKTQLKRMLNNKGWLKEDVEKYVKKYKK